MLRVGEQRIDETWEDLLTVHRWARLKAQGPFVLDHLMGIAMEGMACQRHQALAAAANLSADRALRMRDTLVAMPLVPSVADKLDTGDRLECLDYLCVLARGDRYPVSELWFGGLAEEESAHRWHFRFYDMVLVYLVDWNYCLRAVNEFVDELIKAHRKPTFPKRKVAVDELRRKLEDARQGDLSSGTIPHFLVNPDRARVSRQIAGFILELLAGTHAGALGVDDRCFIAWQLAACGYALAAHRAEHGRYPDSLAELVPRYLPAVPEDVFTPPQKVIYRRTEEEVIIYGRGANRVDDGGRLWQSPPLEDGSYGDDVVFRIKVAGY